MLEPQPIWHFALGYMLVGAGLATLVWIFTFVLWKGWDE